MPGERSIVDIRGPTDFALDLLADNMRTLVAKLLAKEFSYDKHETGYEIVERLRSQIKYKNSCSDRYKAKHSRRYERDPISWTPDDLLDRLTVHWDEFFKYHVDEQLTKNSKKVNEARLRMLNDLIYLRNNWAHRDNYDTQEVLHFLSTAGRLLRSLKFPEAAASISTKKRQLELAIATDQPSLIFMSPTNGSWATLTSMAVRTEAVQLMLVPSLNPSARTRALGPVSWKNVTAIRHFTQSDRVRVEVNLQHPDSKLGEFLPLYCLCLVVDSEQVTCLCPNSDVAPINRIDSRVFCIPAKGVGQPLEFFGAAGHHTIYILLSRAPIPKTVREPLQKPQSLGFLDQVSEELCSIPDQRLTLVKPRALIAVIDACRTSPFADPRYRSMRLSQGLGHPTITPTGVLIVYSAGANQEALDRLTDDDGHPNGLFTREILPLLLEPGLEFRSLVRRAGTAVQKKAREIAGHEQTPAMYDQLLEDFFLIPVAENHGRRTTTTSVSYTPEVATIADNVILASQPRFLDNEQIIVTGAHKHILVFISHCEEDLDVARVCDRIFATAGFSTSGSTQEALGPDLDAVSLPKSIENCHFFVVILSDHAMRSELLQRELGLAFEVQKQHGGYRPMVIPVVAADTTMQQPSRTPIYMPTRDFVTGEQGQTFPLNIRGLVKHGVLTSVRGNPLLPQMQPTLRVSRYNFNDAIIFDETEVFSLNDRLFPPYERDSRQDIINWVLVTDVGTTREVLLPRSGKIQYQLDSRYFIMVLGGKAIGLAFFTYDYDTHLVFGNYIGVEQSWRSTHLEKSFVDRIVEVLGQLFPDYRGIGFEVEKLDRNRLNEVISSLEETNDKQFMCEDDRDEIRKFLRSSWYQSIGCKFFIDVATKQPLECTSPCLDPEADNWASEQHDFWIMWYNRPGAPVNYEKEKLNELWKETVHCIYIEVLAKSLVDAYPEYAEEYWEYANRIVAKPLNYENEITLGRYLHRHDDNLMRRWVKLGIEIAI